MVQSNKLIGLGGFLTAMIWAAPVCAQSTEGALQLGLGAGILNHSSLTVTTEAAGVESDTDSSNTSWGIGDNAFGEIGYGLGDSMVLGALVTLQGASSSSESEGGTESESSEFEFTLGPKFDYMFSAGQSVRPFVGAVVAFALANQEQGSVETSLTGFMLAARGGLRAFLAKGFSLDPSLMVGWSTFSGDLDVGAASADVSASGFNVQLSLSFSGWLE